MGTCRLRVLLVDDDAELTRILADVILETCDADITFAADGEECLALLHEHRYDLMFLDLVMPVMDGFGVLQAVRADEDIKPGYLVAISGLSTTPGYLEAALDGGADVMIGKPIDIQEIGEILSRASVLKDQGRPDAG